MLCVAVSGCFRFLRRLCGCGRARYTRWLVCGEAERYGQYRTSLQSADSYQSPPSEGRDSSSQKGRILRESAASQGSLSALRRAQHLMSTTISSNGARPLTFTADAHACTRAHAVPCTLARPPTAPAKSSTTAPLRNQRCARSLTNTHAHALESHADQKTFALWCLGVFVFLVCVSALPISITDVNVNGAVRAAADSVVAQSSRRPRARGPARARSDGRQWPARLGRATAET